MLRLVLRPLLVVLTLGLLLVALFQVTGRIAFALLDHLQPTVNGLLAGRGVVVSGLSGDWRMLNPVLRAERVELPAGQLEGLELELDMMASVWHGIPLARRLKVADARVDLEKRPGEPWRLAGGGEPAGFDPLPYLRHSEQLEFDGRVRFLREGEAPAEILLGYLGLNRGGEHRHALAIANHPDDCVDDCRITVDYLEQEGLWPLRPARARLQASSHGFLLPRTVLGFSPVQLARLELAWQRLGDDTGGSLELRAAQFDMPGDLTLATALSGAVRGRGGVQKGSVTGWRVEQGDEVWALPDVSLRSDADGVSAWMPELDLERAGTFLRQALAAVEPVERWLGALNVRGRAHNVRVAFGTGGGLAYAATLDAFAMDGFKGVPFLRNGGGELLGHARGLQLNLNAQNLSIAFPEIFTETWDLPYAQGTLQAWFGPDYFGIRGLNLRGETLGTRAAGGFAMSRPPDREGQRLLLLVSSDRIGVTQAQQFVPYKLPEDLQRWLKTAPRGGVLEDPRLAYQGQFQDEPGELGRRLELTARLRDAQLRYHPDWPLVTGLSGDLSVAGPLVEVDVAGGSSAGAELAGSGVRVVDNAASVEVSLDAQTDGNDLLGFLRTTPLARWVGFVEPDWQSAGPLRLAGELTVPLGDEAGEPAVRLRADLEGVNLELPGYRLALDDLTGSVRYRYPYFVDAVGVTGKLFDAPVTVAASTAAEADGDRVHLRFAGRAGPADVWRLTDLADPGLASGAFDFDADLGIAVDPGVNSRLTVTSALQDLALTLPAGYGKAAGQATPGRVQIDFRPAYRALRFEYRDARGWLHVADRPLGGAVGFAAEPAAEDPAISALVLGGHLDGFALDEVIPEAGGETALPLPLELRELVVGEIGVGDFAVTDATLNGRVASDGFDVEVGGNEVVGRLSRQGDVPMLLVLSEVRLPADESDADPLDPALIDQLPSADVVVEGLWLGDADYGRWQFEMRPDGSDLVVRALQAEVRGVTISAPDGLVWHGARNETRFRGSLDGGNLAEVLPQWGYAANVETESAALTGAFSWDGSPAAVDLLLLRGEAQARATNGRFLEVESGSGAQKIFSLLNFTAIAKRMALNFGDVFGRGISFDELNAEFALDEGMLEFIEPMQVAGTGSRFRVTGRVNLDSGALDNEMIVTLPVSQSLPWYAAYVALANPLAGLGVLVGERVLRKPLEQFSSARYRISGTLDNPEVKFVSVFDVTTPAAEGAKPGAAAGAAAEQEDSSQDE